MLFKQNQFSSSDEPTHLNRLHQNWGLTNYVRTQQADKDGRNVENRAVVSATVWGACLYLGRNWNRRTQPPERSGSTCLPPLMITFQDYTCYLLFHYIIKFLFFYDVKQMINCQSTKMIINLGLMQTSFILRQPDPHHSWH